MGEVKHNKVKDCLQTGIGGITTINVDQDYGLIAAGIIGSEIQKLLIYRPHVVLAVCGGNSIVPVFDALQIDKTIDWKRIHIFLVDDRLVPTDHPDSNGRLILELLAQPLIDSRQLPAMNLHLFRFNPEYPDSGCEDYTCELGIFGGKFDVVLLSAGEDGHVAGLFPNHAVLENTSTGYISFHDSPKPPSGRMTASAALLTTASYAVLLIIGEKKTTVGALYDLTVSLNTCPAKIVIRIPTSFIITNRVFD